MKRTNQDEIGQCECCHKHDEDVVLCSASGCHAEIHPKCGAVCEACGAVLCEEHVIEVADLPVCLRCAPEALLENILQNAAITRLTKTPSAA